MPFPSFSSPSRIARGALVAAAVGASSVFMAVGPARAATDVPDSGTSALVTRVSVAGGQAWVTVQVRIAASRVAGFEVHVPAGDDAWSGPADVAVNELGTHCRSVGTRDLHYVCGDVSGTRGDTPYLPLGGYQVTIPVTHTGTLPVPRVGHTWVDSVDEAGAVHRSGFDAFPVVDDSHFLSTVELRSAPLQADPGTTLSGLATVPLSVTVVPGEQVASLDVTLPNSAAWTLVGTNALPQGVWCSERDATSGIPILHCAGRFGAPLPVGRYELVSTLRFVGPNVDGRTARVGLTMVGGVAEQMDTCHFRFPTTA